MTIYAKRAAVTQKVEVTYGTDVTPAAASDAMLVHNLRIDPLKNAYVPRNPVLPYYANMGEVVAASWSEISYEVELAGAGTAGNAAPYAAALKSCALAQTLNPGTDAQYAPVSSGASSSSLYYYEDGLLHKILGMMGNVSFRLSAGGDPMAAFSFKGLHVALADAALISPTLTGFGLPVAVNKANTTPFTLHSTAGVFSDLTIDLGNQMEYTNKPNFEGIRFVGRRSTGKVTLEKELVATADWRPRLSDAVLGALAVTHGLTAGNIIKLDAPQVQLTNWTEGEDRGVKVITMDMHLQPTSAGNNEFKLTVK